MHRSSRDHSIDNVYMSLLDKYKIYLGDHMNTYTSIRNAAIARSNRTTTIKTAERSTVLNYRIKVTPQDVRAKAYADSLERKYS